jgi:tetratricopeptide (TPR) repeat protein
VIVKNKKQLTFDEAFEQYHLAIKYKRAGACVQAIEVLIHTINQLSMLSNPLNELHLISVLQDALVDIYVEINVFEKALYFLEESLSNIDVLLNYENQDSLILYENQALKVRDMAFLYQALYKYDDAIIYFKKAIVRYELLMKIGGKGEDAIFFINREISILKLML